MRITAVVVTICAALSGVASGCSDPTEPPIEACTGACEGLSLRIDSATVRPAPNESKVYSGDSLVTRVFITNTSNVDSDTSTFVLLTNGNNVSETMQLPPIRAGRTLRVEIPTRYPTFSRSLRTRDSLHVELYRQGPTVPHEYQFHDETFTRAYDFAPTTLTLRDVPTILHYPSRDTAELVITNPSPRTIRGDSLTICVHDIDYCIALGETADYPDVPARQTFVMQLPLNIGKPISWTYEARDDVDLRVCVGAFVICTFPEVDARPAYEQFCAVRRLEINVTLNGTTSGRDCAVLTLADRLDVLSFEAEAGGEFQITGPSGIADILTADGQLMPVFVAISTGVREFSTPVAGRYYVVVVRPPSAENYSIRVERVP